MKKQKNTSSHEQAPEEKKKPGRPKKADAKQGELPTQKPSGDLYAHLYVGPRDVRIPLKEADYIKVLKDQQELRRAIQEAEERLLRKDEQIEEADDQLKKLRAERRDIEDVIEERADRILDIIDANKDEHHIERMQVEEVFLSGEIVTYRKGTKEEVCKRRNALDAEWAAAQQIKDDKGRPVTRYKKGKPDKDGKVILDNGEKVEGVGDMGYIGPNEDPSRPPRRHRGDKPEKSKPAKEPKTLPTSLKLVPPLPLEKTEGNKEASNKSGEPEEEDLRH